ncbi:unnamed protein product [Clonostachys rosea f. rosea IK726]|jgi:hypothetical protein|uniref:Uncharacterized protein n=1 Tax=Clonostachys rosea f. rosea IK726 TaxID=1349383 RepID=A0ACA9TZ84_BIOOC|nr:unnamed protein product [Clonostachys rosea f. rosea IK726]
MDAFDDPAAQDALDDSAAQKAFGDPIASRPWHSTLLSYPVAQVHRVRIRREKRSLERLFDRILLATHPLIVFQAENSEWELVWTPETDPIYGRVARSFIRRLQTWVATPPSQRTEVITAEEIATLWMHIRRFRKFEKEVKMYLKCNEEMGHARGKWFGDPRVKRVLMRQSRDRRSRMRNCVSADEV